MKQEKISEAVVRRLPVYWRFLNDLRNAGVQTVSSQDLGEKLGLNPAQIRKDLAYFGEFGRKGVGYDVAYLIEKIRQILKLDKTLHVALAGTGNLGKALCNYNMYNKDNMKIVALFDTDVNKIGMKINSMIVQPIEELSETVARLGITLGIITAPAVSAQQVTDQFVAAGIKGILNFAPVVLKVPDDVRIHYADFTADLLSLAYYMGNDGRNAQEDGES